jgi:cyclophilin family peptidyl-prolyl cis-trans isomerase
MSRLVLLAAVALSACATTDAPSREVERTVRVRFETTQGDFWVEVHRDWAPRGAERFLELVRTGFYDGCRFFRVVPEWVVQWGINGDPAVNARWSDERLEDDPVMQPNRRGTIAFAASDEPNTRTTQVFINYADHSSELDPRGFAPIGEVVEGMDVVDALNSEYGEKPTDKQDDIMKKGNVWLDEQYPNLDWIRTARIVEGDPK